MIAVLDVSAAIEILFQKPKSGLFNEIFQAAAWVIAPDLYVHEISNVLWKIYHTKAISHQDCIQHAGDGIQLIDDFIDSRDLWKEALSEGIKNNHSIYDMYYAVLTRRNDATLITNDGQLAALCRQLHIPVCH